MNRTWGPASGHTDSVGWARKGPEYQDSPPHAFGALDVDPYDVSPQAFDIADVENRALDKAKAKEKSTKF